MNIAYFTETYEPSLNGVTTVLNNFRRTLRAKGHTVYIFAPRVRGYKDTDPDVFRLPALKVVNSEPEGMIPVPMPAKVYQNLSDLDFDLIHAHGNAMFSLFGYQVARMRRIPFVLTFHNDHEKYTHYIFKGKLIRPRFVALGMRIFAQLCDGVLTPSAKMKQGLVNYGVKKPITIIPNFVENERFVTANKEFLYKELKIPASEPILINVGRLTKEKNLEFVIRVFAKVYKKNPKVNLVLVGRGPEERNLKNIAKKLGVAKKVYFTGTVAADLMPQVYNSSSLLFFPSVTEVHPLAVLEAAASGLPLVTSNDVAFEGIVKNDFNGYALPLKEDKFVAAIEKLLADSDLMAKFGKNARDFIVREYNPEKITNDLVAYYEEVIAAYNKNQPRKILLPLVQKVAFNGFVRMSAIVNKFISY